MGTDPTGNAVRFTPFDSTRIGNGVVVEEWFTMDVLGLLERLDAIPASAVPSFAE